MSRASAAPALLVRACAPIVLAAGASGALLLLSPHLPIADAMAQDLCAIVLGIGAALTALHVSSAGAFGRAVWIFLAVGVGALAVVYFASVGPFAVPLQVFGLLSTGRVIGGAIGKRVQHPGHVLPATLVAAAADCASLLSPEGITHAVSQDERALATFALAAAIPGTTAITYLLGIGDLIVMAMLLGVAREHGVSALRVTLACVVSLAVAFACSALWQSPIPALVPIAVFVNLLVPAFRRVAPKDRRVAALAAALALGLVVVVALRR